MLSWRSDGYPCVKGDVGTGSPRRLLSLDVAALRNLLVTTTAAAHNDHVDLPGVNLALGRNRALERVDVVYVLNGVIVNSVVVNGVVAGVCCLYLWVGSGSFGGRWQEGARGRLLSGLLAPDQPACPLTSPGTRLKHCDNADANQ